ncbi:MAG: DNA polymerase III subunit epsilon, partial [Rhodospirillales bacterium]|nr:DNA polymerase III subunit epsilon [Rhodospirillales bacterium]
MREIVLDTETTGLDPKSGHRIVEIGCIELDNHMPTGETYHQYINPRRDMPEEAFRVHGLSQEYLADFPVFSAVAQDFVDFIGDAKLVIHNASFDMGFINAELGAVDLEAIPMDRAIDTVTMARRKFPGARANLDALCQRFG